MSGFTPIPQEQATEIHKIVSACMKIIKGLRELHKNRDGFCAECSQMFPIEYPCDTMKVVIFDGEKL